jgi:hypothetical protein
MVTAMVAVIFAIIAGLVALIRRKKIRRILLYGLMGLIIGLPVGHVITPFIISFY